MPVNTKNYKSGEVLFSEGDPATSLFIMRKGAVSIRKMKHKTYVEVARIAANEVIGELAFFDRLPRSATAVALNDVEAIEITFDSMENIYASMPDYMKTIVAAMAERLRKANEAIRAAQQKD
jgi:CRP-like cAMP-binding protein